MADVASRRRHARSLLPALSCESTAALREAENRRGEPTTTATMCVCTRAFPLIYATLACSVTHYPCCLPPTINHKHATFEPFEATRFNHSFTES